MLHPIGFYTQPITTLLIDSLSVSPSYAYSVRKLKASYSGACLRVRRSSDNTEQDIGFSGNYIDTASLLSFVGSGSGFVRTWYDQVGSANLQQTTAANQPRIVDAGTIEVANSLPSLRSIASSSYFLQATVSVTGTTFSAHAVGTMNSATHSYGRLVGLGNGSADDGGSTSYAVVVCRGATNNNVIGYRNTQLGLCSISLATLSTIGSIWNGSNHVMRVNGSASSTSSSSGNFSSTNLMVCRNNANGQYWDGNVSELLVFTNATSESSTIEVNQKAFFSTP